MKRLNPLLAIAIAGPLLAAPPEMATVTSHAASGILTLPGEFEPYEQTAITARVPGYVEQVKVDRGSVVRKGQVLITLSAPELAAQTAEARSQAQAAEAQRAEAAAQLAAAEATRERLKAASATPGAIAANELVQAEKTVDAARALVTAREESKRAAEDAVRAARQMEQYLSITAPFSGTITERTAHPGLLAGPSSGAMLELQDLSRLRLIVALPEAQSGRIVRGARVAFRVPAYPGETFSGTVARVAHALDPKTRTMPVELDVINRGGRLSPGMYPQVDWPLSGGRTALVVPATSVVTTTERTFVIRDRQGKAEWVNVKKGAASGEQVEVSGALQPGDRVVRRATDELRDGQPLPR